ncbi:MAG: hypothetical protein NXH80_15145 [Rhodobacteraceae bacterium]|nr:hypothetical protein [Paracoccaceae bacterium]
MARRHVFPCDFNCHQSLHRLKTVIQIFLQKGILCESNNQAVGIRRNLVVSGLNMAALRGALVSVGTTQLRITTVCAPCSRMETALGHGGYTAMRGHGGCCAEVVAPGRANVGDPVRVLEPARISKS